MFHTIAMCYLAFMSGFGSVKFVEFIIRAIINGR